MAAPAQPALELDYKTMCVGLGCATPIRRAIVAAALHGV